jgi:Tfp pilus assembly protein PilE
MKTRNLQFGLTLVDMLIAVAIVAILAGIVLTTLTRIDSKAKEQLCEATLETLNTALRQFHDYGYQYQTNATGTELEFYRSLKFPPDCNSFTEIDVENEIKKLLDLAATANITTDGKHDPNESGIAVMYFFLSQVPECRQTLGNIDKTMLKSDHDGDEDYLKIQIDSREYPWLRVVDPWGTPLRYDYYDESDINFDHRKDTIRSFPLITSAGPDGQFDTNDDITNRDKTKGTEYQN